MLDDERIIQENDPGQYASEHMSEPVYTDPNRIAYQEGRKDNVYREEPRKTKKEKKGWTAGRVIALALVCALLGGLFGMGGSLLILGREKSAVRPGAETQTILEGSRPTVELQIAKVNTGKLLTPSEVYAANVNSTVGITTSITTTNYWGFQTTSAASGSGFILTEDGYILTNNHVVEDSSSVKVTAYDGTAYDAVIVGCDAENDIAVLKIDAAELTPVVLGSSDALSVGESVLAIGNPLGELTFSLTYGVVSALDRNVTFSDGTSMKLIQTDCAINSGNSGGALFNLYGEVVGITNAKYGNRNSSSASIDNIGFAIPIDTVRNTVEGIIETGMIVKPYIGVRFGTVSAEMQDYGFPAGCVLKEITEGGPAAKAGLQVNDIVTAVDGEPITVNNDFSDAISSRKPGDTVTLTVFRQGEDELLSIPVIIGEIQESAVAAQSDSVQQQPQQQQPYGYGGNGNGGYFFFGNPFGFGF